ncbi:FAD-binding oxidoreductase [Undibacterium sp. RTI2.1]|uniref:FAD-binding oxidoreductase n=1 Tax=unclassified Undibacterium TaxID=2630295 RepID=UPI002AB3F2F3|nr:MULTISPECIES: FAD-binding oxidoreductase [unclassified Undibacterium]MDY7538230.1 FAD-binding oxidoreductase [Undibacterium sp. 5I1]MEB0030878.1 FAD-binding oxidoreductase [Undibacterium sp. RTI2.1]MEB0117445.1 FAD-binding oxidoreductase [Undibacterium sp. RTI2.2]MEB0232598.1 FAD-binding oxidoreductase [Undibacterium sp. 10I3]MEB0259594.1 FAD-binding oxidoreductase [Undibacterium sp. 5I1]
MNEFLTQCTKIVGKDNVICDPADVAPYVTDWRKRFQGKALAVIRPGSTSEVAAVVGLCKQYAIAIVAQGGNTGLVLGSVPDQSGQQIVLSLSRLKQIRQIDTVNNTITVEAGCLLVQVQEAAEHAQRLFPLSLASEGSCTIGGNLSSNAGGTAVLRYGNARELCLGLEVVTANGEVWNGLRGLRKDNTGYDLRDLFIGAEGTLGIITAAVLKLYPQPKAKVTALAALHSTETALELLTLAQAHCGSALTGFELMSEACLQLVHQHFPNIPQPLATPSPQFVLLELSDSESELHANDVLEGLLNTAIEANIITDAMVAMSLHQSQAMWHLREHISTAQAAEGKNIKHDVSLPISEIAHFVNTTNTLLQQAFPECRMIIFGHLGDGNLHYNVSPPLTVSDTDFIQQQANINQIVHDSVHQHNGSISAEHGIGMLKKDEILRYKSDVEMQLMRSIKAALDPHNLMNPGKIL